VVLMGVVLALSVKAIGGDDDGEEGEEEEEEEKETEEEDKVNEAAGPTVGVRRLLLC
jgi:hypothetical protein